ncbi:hypothetical protein D0Y65_018084 [Glycine soja]|uniref:Helitron helicase-like domain-containing protein n=1 Tax=Glycine soja TaxID=3848 RepID=A0A445JXN7_GLYSO|nr:hypothetical protein D0Y65_018084 [Glycine soja]
MDNHQHRNHSDPTQARIKKKANIPDSSEDESFESTQGSASVSSPENQNYMSSANEPAINREGYSDLGDQLMQCSHCNANMWYDERISKCARTTNPRFSLCCGGGKVELPLLQNPPKYLYQLLYDHDTSDSKNYQQNIRTYNMMFAFTSAENEVQNRINAISSPHNQIQRHIVSQLSEMLDEYNVHAKTFRMTRDRLQDGQVDNIKLKLIANREKDGCTYNVPTVPKVVALIVGDFDENSKRDIIIETRPRQSQRIHELHSSYLALQYPLLFLYGEDGYRPDILHCSAPDGKKRKRNRLTMREWFSYRLQCRSNESKTLLNSRRLFQQFVVEGYICPCESTWRIFGFPIHGREPAVERLHFHLLGQHSVVYEDHDDIDDKKRCWHLRKKGYTIGRLLWVPPITGELFYLRMMITVCKGPTSFEDLRTVDNVQYPTYREACFAMGFLQDDKEFIEAIKEAKDWGSAHYIRKLFVLLLLTATMNKPKQVWDQTWHWMADDIVYNYRKSSASPTLQLDDRTLQNLVLLEIEQLLQANQRSLKDYPSMPYPEDVNCPTYLDNSLILAELNYNNQELR